MVFQKKNISIAVIVLFCIGMHAATLRAAMSSSNYTIDADSINSGGILSSSPSYLLEDTIGEQATGISSSTNYAISAGYQAMRTAAISITGAANVALSPTIDGRVGGTANGSTTVTVRTDSAGGYTLLIRASASPALSSGGDSFADYVPAGANPDFDFAVDTAASEFGFSPEGVDITSEYKDDGASCNTGALGTSAKCWRGLSTTNELISQRGSPNSPDGSATTILFRAEAGASRGQDAGTYTAVTTLTALPL